MRCNNNFCFHTHQLNKYLQECEERESEQEFMNEVAFEVAKKEISEKINRLKIYGCDIDDVQYRDDDPFYI
jgi:cytidylate kinase